jgi:hypothetical protein
MGQPPAGEQDAVPVARTRIHVLTETIPLSK